MITRGNPIDPIGKPHVAWPNRPRGCSKTLMTGGMTISCGFFHPCVDTAPDSGGAMRSARPGVQFSMICSPCIEMLKLRKSEVLGASQSARSVRHRRAEKIWTNQRRVADCAQPLDVSTKKRHPFVWSRQPDVPWFREKTTEADWINYINF